MVEALVLTHSDPMRAYACLWAVRYQTRLPDAVVLVNTGGWNTHELGTALDALAEVTEVRLARVSNGNFGEVFGRALAHTRGAVWWLPDDAMPAPDCLALLQSSRAKGARQPTIVSPGYKAEPGEREECPQEVGRVDEQEQRAGARCLRGSCLGLLFGEEHVELLARALPRVPMFADDAIVRVTQPVLVPGAIVYHTRPYRLRREALIEVAQRYVLPTVRTGK